MYGFANIHNNGKLVINGGSFISRGDSVYNTNLAIINDGIFIADNTKALTCANYDATVDYDSICYINGGYFENKNLGETINGKTYSTGWGAIAAEVGGKIYAKNFTSVGKYPIVSSIEKKNNLTEYSTSEVYLCSGNLAATVKDINGNGKLSYSDKVKFTNDTNIPTIANSSMILTSNYTGTCEQ